MELEPTAHRWREHCSLATISTLQPSPRTCLLVQTTSHHTGIMDQKCQAQDNAALETGQKGLNDCTEMTKKYLTWASLSDYQQLSYNFNINIFQGGPLKSQSLMRDSYTPDVFQKAVIDPRHWHGRTINELGRWYEKYFLDLNVQKAMKEKHGRRKKKKDS
ncbi:testis-expressed protein 33-like [Poecile atricapillus]|uniref:testis-expressed protein 33-like n=1 Tax=Poecile atricapillus TaxID=48891 RepID=UPI002739EFB0|nr:testis-expressed protein 33-like [Poecile atricapillus]XP_058718209.1 testis-expressed protein 33-like [Poecile atricapillus]